MRKGMLAFVVACVAALALASTAWASHFPGHDDPGNGLTGPPESIHIEPGGDFAPVDNSISIEPGGEFRVVIDDGLITIDSNWREPPTIVGPIN